VILLASLSLGAYVLSFFGISEDVLRVAGGAVIAMAGWNLLQAPSDDSSTPEPTPDRSASLRAKAFYPLTLPITVGPGSIAVAVALGTGSPHAGLQPVHLAGVGVALVLLCLSIFFCVRYCGRLEKLLGDVGTQIGKFQEVEISVGHHDKLCLVADPASHIGIAVSASRPAWIHTKTHAGALRFARRTAAARNVERNGDKIADLQGGDGSALTHLPCRTSAKWCFCQSF
jgi:MarC family integral membrane protein